MLWFVLFPFAAYAPVMLLWLWPWLRGRRDGLLVESFSLMSKGKLASRWC
jgi:hypothetical protein